MKRILCPCFLILLFCYGCKAQKVDDFCGKHMNNVVLLMDSEAQKLNTKNIEILNIVLPKPSMENVLITNLFSDEYFGLIKNFNINSEDDVVHFDNLFSHEDYDYLKKQFDCNNSTQWTEIIDFKNSNKGDDRSIAKKLSYSVPVFDQDGKYAFVYVESEFSGELKVFNNVDGKWLFFAQSTIWIN